MSDEIKREDGPNRIFSTGAEGQAASGKGTPVLVPGDAIIDVAKHFEEGANLYSPRNWEKGIPLSESLNSLERHLQQEKMGMTDEPHARALAWRALVYLATKLRIEKGLLPASLNDMPTYRLEHEIILEPFTEEFIEEVLAINEEMAEGFDKIESAVSIKTVASNVREENIDQLEQPDEDVEEIVDTEKSVMFEDGKWFCSKPGCLKRGFSNTAPNTFYCDEHRKGN